ncbi:MAG: ATP-binding protein [Geobacteraceae bacterium]|nr:ATP-binding protein [Geobacteraceae bacterium]
MKFLNCLTLPSRKAAKNFTTKIFLALALSTVFISVAFTAVFIHSERKNMMDTLLNKGGLLAKELAESSRIAVFAENGALLTDPINAVMNEKEARAASVFTRKGKLLRSSTSSGFSGGKKDSVKPGISNGLSGQTVKQIPFYRQNGTLIEFWAPVASAGVYSPQEALVFTDNPEQNIEQFIGYVTVVLDTSLMDKAFHVLLLKSILMSMAFLVITLAVAFFFAKSITRPLNSLKERVYAIGAGKETTRMPIETDDEIGELARAFNDMAEALRMREAEKEHLAAQLQHAQKMEAIGQLAGGVAHDFNNILCAIIGFGALLDMSMQKGDPSRRHLEQILSAADRATSLVQGLLAFSRKQIINPKAVDLNDVVRNIEKMITRLISEDIELIIRLAEKKLYVFVDTSQIDQVMLNLVTNARDAMPNGGTLCIETDNTLPNSEIEAVADALPGTRYALLTITDTGTGIENETREKIFEPFFTTKEVGKGTGLGLSMAYGIVRQHNGHITLTSEIGKGTAFRIYLPLASYESLPSHLVESPITPVSGSETLLMVEDNQEVRNLNRLVLETFGYRVIEAVDGEEAVIRFNEHSDEIDMVVMDVVMPKMNGREAYVEISKNRPGMKVLFISGYAPDFIESKGIATEGFNFINKPVAPMDLLKTIREILDS